MPGLAAADSRPLILTALLDTATQEFFEQQRHRWFPSHLNLIPAHVTLFHHLPGERCDAIRLELMKHCAAWAESPLAATELRFLGRGVAYSINSPGLAAFRGMLARLWQSELTAQDRQGWRPHVTIQNKVAPAQARALYSQLQAEFRPVEGRVAGVCLWRYLDGPWEGEAIFPFGKAPCP